MAISKQKQILAAIMCASTMAAFYPSTPASAAETSIANGYNTASVSTTGNASAGTVTITASSGTNKTTFTVGGKNINLSNANATLGINTKNFIVNANDGAITNQGGLIAQDKNGSNTIKSNSITMKNAAGDKVFTVSSTGAVTAGTITASGKITGNNGSAITATTVDSTKSSSTVGATNIINKTQVWDSTNNKWVEGASSTINKSSITDSVYASDGKTVASKMALNQTSATLSSGSQAKFTANNDGTVVIGGSNFSITKDGTLKNTYKNGTLNNILDINRNGIISTFDNGTVKNILTTNASGSVFSTKNNATDGQTIIKGGTITSKTIKASDDVISGNYSLKELGKAVDSMSSGTFTNTIGVERSTGNTNVAAGKATTTIEKTLKVNGLEGTVSNADNSFSVAKDGSIVANSLNGVTVKVSDAKSEQNGDILLSSDPGDADKTVNISQMQRDTQDIAEKTTDISYDKDTGTTIGNVNIKDGTLTATGDITSTDSANNETYSLNKVGAESAKTAEKTTGIEYDSTNNTTTVDGVKIKDTAANTAGIIRRNSGENYTTVIEPYDGTNGILEVNNKGNVTINNVDGSGKVTTTTINGDRISTGTIVLDSGDNNALRVGNRAGMHTRTDDEGFYLYEGNGDPSKDGNLLTQINKDGVKVNSGDVQVAKTDNSQDTYSLRAIGDATQDIRYDEQTGTKIGGVVFKEGTISNGKFIVDADGNVTAAKVNDITIEKVPATGDDAYFNGANVNAIDRATTEISYSAENGTTVDGVTLKDGAISNNNGFSVDAYGNLEATTINGENIKEIAGDTKGITRADKDADYGQSTTTIEGRLEVDGQAGTVSVKGDNGTFKVWNDGGVGITNDKGTVFAVNGTTGAVTTAGTISASNGNFKTYGDGGIRIGKDEASNFTVNGTTGAVNTVGTISASNGNFKTYGDGGIRIGEDGASNFTVDGENGNVVSVGNITSTTADGTQYDLNTTGSNTQKITYDEVTETTSIDGAMFKDGDVVSNVNDKEYSLNTIGGNTEGITRSDDNTTTTIEGKTTIKDDGSFSTADGKFQVNSNGDFTAANGSFNVSAGSGTTTVVGSQIISTGSNGSVGRLDGATLNLTGSQGSTQINQGTATFNDNGKETVIVGDTISTGTLSVDNIKLGNTITDKDGNPITGIEINADGSISAASGNFTVEKDTGSLDIGKGALTVDGTTGAFSAAKDKFQVDEEGNINSTFDGDGKFIADGIGVSISTDNNKNGLVITDEETKLSSSSGYKVNVTNTQAGLESANGKNSVVVNDEDTTLISGDSSVVVDENGTTFENGLGNGSTNINGSAITSTDVYGSTGALNGDKLTLTDTKGNQATLNASDWNLTNGTAGTTITAGGASFDKGNGDKTTIDGGTITTGTTVITKDSITTDTLNVNNINLKGEIRDDDGDVVGEGNLAVGADGTIVADYNNKDAGVHNTFISGATGVHSTFTQGDQSASSHVGYIDGSAGTVGIKDQVGANTSTTMTDGKVETNIGTNTSTTMTDGKVETNVGNTTVKTEDGKFSATGEDGKGMTVDTETGETVFEGNNKPYIKDGATNTTINGNTITTGKITTDELVIKGTGTADDGKDPAGSVTIRGDGSLDSTVKDGDKETNFKTDADGVHSNVTDGTNTATSNTTADAITNFVADKDGNSATTTLNKDGFDVTTTTKDGGSASASITGSDVIINKDGDNQIKLSEMGKVGDLDEEIRNNANYDGTVVGGVNAEADIRRSEISRLDSRVDSLDKRVGDVEERLDKVGAMSAAIANLRTMGYDPQAPTEIAIGVGQYKSETGIALGMFHYPNEDFMLSLSVSTSGDEVMGGIGATWKLGRKGGSDKAKQTPAKKVVNKEVQRQQKAAEIKEAALKAKIAAQKARHAQLLAEIENVG